MTVRHSRRLGSDPAALAARLPEDLRTFGTYTDMAKRRDEIVTWIDAHQPGHGSALAEPVMSAVGLTYLSVIRDRLTGPKHQRSQAIPSPSRSSAGL